MRTSASEGAEKRICGDVEGFDSGNNGQLDERRTLQAAEIARIRAILVHEISEEAKQFHEQWGFIASPIEPVDANGKSE